MSSGCTTAILEITNACLVALASCQTPSDCSSTSFNFYNGIEQGRENVFDWVGDNFDDGTSDTFDSFFFMDFNVNGTDYSIGDFYSSPIAYTCENGTTDATSYAFATYTYNITETLQVYRAFYAPRSTSWIRVVDSFRNIGPEALNITVAYSGDLGSDGTTTFHNVTEYVLISSDNGDSGDPPLSINWAGRGGKITPYTNLVDDFQFGDGTFAYSFENIIVPAGEFRSVMNVIGQHLNVKSATTVAFGNLDLPLELYPYIADDELVNIVNWDLCPMSFQVVEPQSVYCTSPAMVTFLGTGNSAIIFGGNTINSVAREFTLPVVNGATQFSYTRTAAGCPAGSATFNFKVASANLSLAIDTSGDWPVVSAAGGFGQYSYSWSFPSGGDLGKAFGATATVTVVDKEMCAAAFDVEVPAAITSTPTNVSGSSRLVAALFGVAALSALL